MPLLSEQQVADFSRDGVLRLRGVLTQAEVEGLRIAVDQQIKELGSSSTGYDFEDIAKRIWLDDEAADVGSANRFDISALKNVVRADDQALSLLDDFDAPDGAKGLFLYDVAAWKRFESVRRAAFDSALPEIAAQLLNANYVHFWEDTTFVKGPFTRQRTAFHQDLAYFQIDGDQCLIIWMPLDPADLDNGVTQYVRGSHLWDDEFAPNVFIANTPVLSSNEKRGPNVEADPDAYDIISFDVEPGDVIVNHIKTIHGAGSNRTNRMRRAMSFRYCGDTVRYKDRPGAVSQVGVTHRLRDGDRLLVDDYPVVWPKPWPGLRLAPLYPDIGHVARGRDGS